MVFVAKKW